MTILLYAKSSLQWILDCFVSYFSTMGELIRNTFDRAHFPGSSFTFVFDWTKNNALKQLRNWVWSESNAIFWALMYAIIICLFLKCICSCCRFGRPKRKMRKDGQGKILLMHEAKRWFAQAEHDHESAMNDMHDDTPAFEWVCFKCQQASEKAVKAAIMIKHSQDNFSKAGHDLTVLTRLLRDPGLEELAAMLHGHIGVTPRMRYPDMLPYPQIPRDVYTEQMATDAWDITDEIISHIRQQYMYME